MALHCVCVCVCVCVYIRAVLYVTVNSSGSETSDKGSEHESQAAHTKCTLN